MSKILESFVVPLGFPLSVVLFIVITHNLTVFHHIVPFLAPVAGCLLIAAAVFNWTTIASYAQLGSLQERGATWSSWTRPLAAVASVGPLQTGAKKKDVSASGPEGRDEEAHLQRKRPGVVVALQPRVSYTLAVLNMIATAWIAGANPLMYYLWYTPKAVGLTFHRWWTFRKQNQHYLLYDFCYWATAITVIYLWFAPRNPEFFEMVFVIANGPLAFSVLAFSHSLIFHSVPHTTSLLIHASPAVLTHLIRWHSPILTSSMYEAAAKGIPAVDYAAAVTVPNITSAIPIPHAHFGRPLSGWGAGAGGLLLKPDGASVGVVPGGLGTWGDGVASDGWPRFVPCVDDCRAVEPRGMVWRAFTRVHLPWVCIYYVWVYVVLGNRIKERGYKTLFDRVVQKGFIGRLVVGVSHHDLVQKAAYLATHIVFSLFSMCCAALFWHNRFGHLLFIVSIYCTAAWNGAGFYMSAMTSILSPTSSPAPSASSRPKAEKAAPVRPKAD
eukprot:TRINITY_DN68462_c0_g1_i1.p1 TRINITY_DN68462_c0_g1~~TRINITY_DN68462_c0_g1_i1.p1  ORF type:complete len:497 (-),score=49.98 TRINITY_DN68462_c0_g1_i1:569-2059(-)